MSSNPVPPSCAHLEDVALVNSVIDTSLLALLLLLLMLLLLWDCVAATSIRDLRSAMKASVTT
jgi:hypothetical protein